MSYDSGGFCLFVRVGNFLQRSAVEVSRTTAACEPAQSMTSSQIYLCNGPLPFVSAAQIENSGIVSEPDWSSPRGHAAGQLIQGTQNPDNFHAQPHVTIFLRKYVYRIAVLPLKYEDSG
jgi:hypothetical protein